MTSLDMYNMPHTEFKRDYVPSLKLLSFLSQRNPQDVAEKRGYEDIVACLKGADVNTLKVRL